VVKTRKKNNFSGGTFYFFNFSVSVEDWSHLQFQIEEPINPQQLVIKRIIKHQQLFLMRTS